MKEQSDLRNDRGFTLVEILVVILIVAVLAAIAIPMFLGSRDKGYAAQVQSTLKGASTAAGSVAIESGYEILNDNEALLAANGFNPTDGIQLGITSTDSSFCIAATHVRASSRTDWQVGSYSSSVGKPVAGGSTCPEAAVLADVAEPPVVAIVDDTSGSAGGSGEGNEGPPATEPEGSGSGETGSGGTDPDSGSTGGTTDGGTDGDTGSTDGTTDPGTGSTDGTSDPGTSPTGGSGKEKGGGKKK